jgi:hypothetical protein
VVETQAKPESDQQQGGNAQGEYGSQGALE